MNAFSAFWKCHKSDFVARDIVEVTYNESDTSHLMIFYLRVISYISSLFFFFLRPIHNALTDAESLTNVAVCQCIVEFYQFQFLSIPSFDPNVVKKMIYISIIFILSLFAKHWIAAAEYHEQKTAGYIKTGLD